MIAHAKLSASLGMSEIDRIPMGYSNSRCAEVPI
jgi:hypothetical protein